MSGSQLITSTYQELHVELSCSFIISRVARQAFDIKLLLFLHT